MLYHKYQTTNCWEFDQSDLQQVIFFLDNMIVPVTSMIKFVMSNLISVDASISLLTFMIKFVTGNLISADTCIVLVTFLIKPFPGFLVIIVVPSFQVYLFCFKPVGINCSYNGSIEEYAARLVKVAWMVFPIGIFFTFAGCGLVFWLKDLSFSDPYAQAILINGTTFFFLQIALLSASKVSMQTLKISIILLHLLLCFV